MQPAVGHAYHMQYFADYRPTPVECVSPFWAKVFPGHDEDISKEGPGGGERKANEKKRSPMTLTFANNRIFVINNGRVAADGGLLGGACATGGKSCIVRMAN